MKSLATVLVILWMLIPCSAVSQTQEQRDAFNGGQVGRPGFGPTFNAVRCQVCHISITRDGQTIEGAFGPIYRAIHLARTEDGTVELIHRSKLDGAPADPIPEDMVALSQRRPPFVAGAALIEAVSNEAILANADPDDVDGDGISGRAILDANGDVARFGWQPKHGNIISFLLEGLGVEFGRTVDDLLALDPEQLTIELLNLIDIIDFTLALPPPPRAVVPPSDQATVAAGEDLFVAIGCADCHIKEIEPGIVLYSDLLGHNLGTEVDDGVGVNGWESDEFRTPPLLGFGTHETLAMHNGQAGLLEHIIIRHGGEASASRDLARNLDQPDRRALRLFLSSL